MKIRGLSVHDVRFPTSRSLDGSDAMHTSPDYSAAYVVLHTRRRAQRPRPDLHERARHGDLRRRDPRARAARRRPDARRDHRGHARLLALARLRRPAALARPGEGRRPPRRRRRRQRGLGPVGEERRPAALAAARRTSRRRSSSPRSTSATSTTSSRRTRRSTSFAPRRDGKAERELQIVAEGYPAYTTSPGWLGYDDEKVAALVRGAATTASGTSR